MYHSHLVCLCVCVFVCVCVCIYLVVVYGPELHSWSCLRIYICPVFSSVNVHFLPLTPLPSIHSKYLYFFGVCVCVCVQSSFVALVMIY